MARENLEKKGPGAEFNRCPIHLQKLIQSNAMPRFGVASQGFSADDARVMFLEAVEGFLEDASPAEVEACRVKIFNPLNSIHDTNA